MKNNDKIIVAVSNGKSFNHFDNKEMLWSEFVDRCQNPTIDGITVEQYTRLDKKSKTEHKNVGSFLGGSLTNGLRNDKNVKDRSLITLDVDWSSESIEHFWERCNKIYPNAMLIYSTRSHGLDKSNFRLIFPLSEPISPEKYEPIARKIAEKLGIENFDEASFKLSQMMYWPSVCFDGVFFFDFQDGVWLNGEEILALYDDWKDKSQRPHVVSQKVPVVSTTKSELPPYDGKHRFVLSPYKGNHTRHICPRCGKSNEFSRYIDTWGIRLLPDDVGRCNREDQCGYHYTPKEYFKENPEVGFAASMDERSKYISQPKRPLSYIDEDILLHSLNGQNNFVTFLLSLFSEKQVTDAVEIYFIGTSNRWSGATIFWQIDGGGRVHTGKVMLYDSVTGKRVKQPFNHINWMHKVLRLPDFNLCQCFFGQHLLTRFTEKNVCIVESEKTAVIMSIIMPECVWLSTGGQNGCNWTTPDVYKALIGRRVILWPDLKCFDKWKEKADKLCRAGITVTVSDLLEKNATDAQREQGCDIADYVIIEYEINKLI